MAETPDTQLSPNSTQFKKGYPHLPTPDQRPPIPGPSSNQANQINVDCGVAVGTSSMQAMEEGIRPPQMVSHPTTAVFSTQKSTSSSPLSPIAGGGGGGVVAWSKSQLKVLVVDDADMNRKMLVALLTRSSIASDSVADGQLAVNAVAAIEGGTLRIKNHSRI